MTATLPPCIIDLIASHQEPAAIVFDDQDFIAFLDHRPLFPGHTLLAPKRHFATVYEVPSSLVGPFFLLTQRLGLAVEKAMGAAGSFIAINNTVSQSIPHVHVHIVPRNRRDGLKGFFWPRTRYDSDSHMAQVRDTIRHCLDALPDDGHS